VRRSLGLLVAVSVALTACAGVAPIPRTTPSPPAPVSQASSWPVYHHDPQRSGGSLDTPVPRHLGTSWRTSLDGAVFAEPLEVEGEIIAATENDSLYAISPRNGRVVWRTHLGTPVAESALPCGDIFPLGITGTPAYDPKTGSIFAVAEETGPEHILYAVDPRNGVVRWSRSLDIQIPSEAAAAVQQRPALAISEGYVYIGFGGLDGDCGQYRGALVAVPTSGRGSSRQYLVPTSREGAIWATGGPVVTPGGDLLVSTGNGAATAPPWDHTDSVLELSPRLGLIGAFAPLRWAADNAQDLDLGSVAPTLLPDGEVFIAGKSGLGYLLSSPDLGGIGGQLFAAPVCRGQMAFGATSFDGDNLYLPCANGVQEISVARLGSFAVGWQTTTGADGPPVLGGSCVWSLDTSSGVLFALSQQTGAAVAQLAVGPVPHFASPTLIGSVAVVGTDSGLVAVSGA